MKVVNNDVYATLILPSVRLSVKTRLHFHFDTQSMLKVSQGCLKKTHQQ